MGQGFANQRPGINISAGTTLANSGSVVLSNANGFTFGMSSVATNSAYTVTVIGGPVVSAGTQSVHSGTVIFSNSNGVSFGVSGSTVTMSTGNPVKFWDSPGERDATLTASNVVGNETCSLQRFLLPYPMNVTQIDVVNALSVAGSTAFTILNAVGLYTISNKTLSLLSSISTSNSFTSGTNSTASSVYGANSGTRVSSIPLGTTWVLTPGEYLLAFGQSWQGAAATITMFGRSSQSIVGDIGGGNITRYFGDGVFTCTQDSNATPVFQQSIHQTNVTQMGQACLGQPYFRLLGS